MFLATVLVALISHLFARLLKAPVTLFLVSGILPLVPGVAMYRIVYYLLRSDFEEAGYNAFLTIQIAGAIALAVFVVDSIFKMNKKTIWSTEFRILRDNEKSRRITPALKKVRNMKNDIVQNDKNVQNAQIGNKGKNVQKEQKE